jgi:hypothetical protein
MRLLKPLLFVAILALIAAPAFAQMSDPGGAGGAAAPGAAPMAGMQHIQGKVDKVDQANNQLQVSGQMLMVDSSTQIMNQQGQKMNLSSIKEGDQVKASYRSQAGQNMAKSITVMPKAGGDMGGGTTGGGGGY